MIRPDEIRLMANQWRNVAGAASSLNDYMRSAGMQGCEVLHGLTVAQHAEACAQRLEEHASEVEQLELAKSAENGDGS